MSILGTRLSFKLPKVRVFKKKTEEWRREPEWSWQAVHTPTHRITQPHSHPHAHSSLKDPRHRFLSRDQVDTIHQWLDQVPGPGEEEQGGTGQDTITSADLITNSQYKQKYFERSS